MYYSLMIVNTGKTLEIYRKILFPFLFSKGLLLSISSPGPGEKIVSLPGLTFSIKAIISWYLLSDRSFFIDSPVFLCIPWTLFIYLFLDLFKIKFNVLNRFMWIIMWISLPQFLVYYLVSSQICPSWVYTVLSVLYNLPEFLHAYVSK